MNVETRYVIRWTAFVSNPDKPFIGFQKNKPFAATLSEARRFESRKMAIDFIKVYLRRGRFAGHAWQNYCEVKLASDSRGTAV